MTMHDPTDPIRRAMAGDQEAQRALLEAWLPRIRRWALIAAGDPVLAEDGVQEALIRIVRHLSRVDPTRPLGPWLKTITVRACRTEHTRERRHLHEVESDEEAPTEPTSGPDQRLDLHRARAQVVAAFSGLSPRQRELVDLVDLQGFTPTEVASQLGLSPGAVRGQLFQARRALRAHLASHHELRQLLRNP